MDSIVRSLDSIDNAIRVYNERNHSFIKVNISYGDASDSPIIPDEDIDSLSKKYCDSFILKYRFFGFNSGPSKGHNILGTECTTDFMQIMNPDIIVAPDFFDHILEPFSRPDVGAVEARQTPIEHPKEYDTETGETSWAATACLLVRTDIFHILYGFDSESFFMYCDDVDFSWRIRLMGKKIIYQPLACAFHAKNLSKEGAWQPTEAEIYYTEETRLMIAYKWSNMTLLNELLNRYSNSNEPILLKALAVFRKKEAAGTLPEQINKDNTIETFIGELYAHHRYNL